MLRFGVFFVYIAWFRVNRQEKSPNIKLMYCISKSQAKTLTLIQLDAFVNVLQYLKQILCNY